VINKQLQGATVAEVYWAVRTRNWLPTIGEKFDSPVEAERYARDVVSVEYPTITIETRMRFEYPDHAPVGGSLDTEVETRYVTYEENIRRITED
jgi:hypothetical protein